MLHTSLPEDRHGSGARLWAWVLVGTAGYCALFVAALAAALAAV